MGRAPKQRRLNELQKKLQVLTFLALCCFSFPAHAGQTLRLTNGEWPPYTSRDLQGYGVFSRIVAEAFATQGIMVEYGFFPWTRAYELARRGEWDGSIAWTATTDREKAFIFSDPVLVSTKVFFHLKSLSFDWQGFDDLKPFIVGVTRGYSYGEAFDRAAAAKRFQVSYVMTDAQNLQRLARGLIDLFPSDIRVGYQLMGKVLDPAQTEQITHHPHPIQNTPLCLIVSRKLADAEFVAEKFNAGLKRLKQSGLYDRYLKTYDIDGAALSQGSGKSATRQSRSVSEEREP